MNGDYKPVGRPLGERGGTTFDRAELRKRAEEASAGDWHIRHDDEVWIGVKDDEVDRYIAGGGFEADSLYIVAAQPQVVLALLDELEACREALKPFARYDELANRGRKASEDEFSIHTTDDDGAPASLTLYVRDFRRARKALSGEKP